MTGTPKRVKREHEPTRRCWCGKYHGGHPPVPDAAAGPGTTGGDWGQPCTTPTAHRADECNGYHLDGSDA